MIIGSAASLGGPTNTAANDITAGTCLRVAAAAARLPPLQHAT